jgi:hypothetical protein
MRRRAINPLQTLTNPPEMAVVIRKLTFTGKTGSDLPPVYP